MTNDSQQPAPFPAGGNQPTTSGSNDAPTHFIPPTEQSVPPTQTMPPVQDVPAQTPSYNDRVYATSLQQVMQAVHDQLSTSATFTADEENVAEGTVTFHAYDGAQFTLKASAQGADGTAIKLMMVALGPLNSCLFLIRHLLCPQRHPPMRRMPRRRRTRPGRF